MDEWLDPTFGRNQIIISRPFAPLSKDAKKTSKKN